MDRAKGAGNVAKAAKPQQNEPGWWDFFLSHHADAAGDKMKVIWDMLEKRGKTAWLDEEMTRKSEDAMKEGVQHCKYFILFLTVDDRATPREAVTPSSKRR